MKSAKRFSSPALLALALAILFCPLSKAYAADIRDEQLHVIIEKVTENDIPRLIELLGHKDPTVRFDAKSFLVSFAGKSVPGLIEALDNVQIRPEVLDVLHGIKDPRSIAPIFRYVEDKDEIVSVRARQALFDMGEKSGPFLLDMLEKKEKIETATHMLAQIQRTEYLATGLRKLLSSPDAELRGNAVYILGEWKDSASAKEVETLLSDKDDAVRENAVAAYQKVTADYNQKALVSLLKDYDVKVRIKAAEILSDVKDAAPAVIDAPLVDAAKKDKDNTVRANALYALAAQNVEGAVLILIEALNDPAEEVQTTALAGIAKLKAEEAVPYIVKMAREHKINSEGTLNQASDTLIIINKPVDIEPFLPCFALVKDNHTATSMMNLVKTFVTDTNRKQAIEAIGKFIADTPDLSLKEFGRETIKSISK